jgi:nitrite reductase/ring-hydroxylating ferredoxin subunit
MTESTTTSASANDRRTFFERCSSYLMLGGLLAGYGTFASILGRFLFPGRSRQADWQYVATLSSVVQGESLTYTSPAGQRVVISRMGNSGTAEDFIALSSVCPHLGCQVHWESQNHRFFCPCHSGAFDPEGNPIAGPVKDANQSLARYPLKIENHLLYIEADLKSLV